jgi:inorganic pyrophosphatase
MVPMVVDSSQSFRHHILSHPFIFAGCLPQTWEDPNVEHPELKCFGDNDPIDVVEIGSSSLAMGSVKEVKPLGVLAMIDDGELDWKVLAIATDDPLAAEYNDVGDVPEAVKAGIREWFR